MNLIRALLNTSYEDNLDHMSIKLLTYLLDNCDYTINQWITYIGKLRWLIRYIKYSNGRFIII